MARENLGSYEHSAPALDAGATAFGERSLARALRLVLWFVAIALLAWALIAPRFRDVEGVLRGTFCLPMASAAALLVLGWAIAGSPKRYALWLALALVGQAVSLQMIEAGTAIRYQHYMPIGRLVKEVHPLLLVYLLMQTVLVAVGIRARWPDIRAWLSRTVKPWQLVALGLLVVLSSAAASRQVLAYAGELVLASFVQVVNLANVVLIAWSLPASTLTWLKRRLDRLLGGECKDARIRLDRFSFLVAGTVTVFAAVLSYAVYERHPHIPDEVIYLYHARYLAEGRLTVPAPPVPEAFSFYLIPYKADRWYSLFPPGWPAMLALGTRAGAPWLVNPLLAGANILLAYLLLQTIYDRWSARLAVLLMSASPWFVFMGMSFMAHTFALTCALVGALGIAWARRSGRAVWGWLGGGAVGTLSLVRPVDGAIVAGVLGLWAIGFGGRRLRVSATAGFILTAMIVGALVLPYNARITGDPLKFPLMTYYEQYFGPKVNALGFGPERGLDWPLDPFPGHSLLDAAINAQLNASAINAELLGWSAGSLFLIALALFSGRLLRSDYSMVAVIVVVVAVYSLYWFSGGPDFGARYWYLTLVPLVALTVRGVSLLRQSVGAPDVRSPGATRVMAGVLVLSLLALVCYFPWRSLDKYHHYRGMRPDIRILAKEHDFGAGLVLVRGDANDYQSAWIYNPLDPQEQVPVYAWDRGEEVRSQLSDAYPERSVWIVNGHSLTQGGFELVSGPLASAHVSPEQR